MGGILKSNNKELKLELSFLEGRWILWKVCTELESDFEIKRRGNKKKYKFRRKEKADFEKVYIVFFKNCF